MRKISIFLHRYFLTISVLYFLCLFWVFKNDLFFGDAISSTSRLASTIFDSGSIFYPEGFDPGHPPTYSILLVLFWALLGKTLAVSHCFGMIWCLILYLGFRKVCGLYLDEKYTNYASILALIHPTFITQNAMMINTAMLMASFIWAVYFLLSKQILRYTLVLIVMTLSHLQGAFFLVGLALADLFLNFTPGIFTSIIKFSKTRFVVYLTPFVFFNGWLFLHFTHSGWWLISPDYSDTHQSNTITQVIKGFLYCGWRFSDFGMIVPIFIYTLLKFKKHHFTKIDSLFWITFSITTIIMSLVLKNTIAHRYFLSLALLFLLIVVIEISRASKYKKLFLSIIFVSLISGSIFYYPGKTIADANIRYRDYFKCYSLLSSQIQNKIVYSKAPIANDFKYLKPESSSYDNANEPIIKRINETPLDSLPCVVSSNICAEFTPEENRQLLDWYGRSFENGAVYVNVFLNPKFNAKPDGWNVRELGKFEKLMIQLKQKFK